ncbi:MAG: transposase [Oscillospiraceae bacterium]|nr:transposase [Oscillospiraceae bacterium]
MVNLLDSNSNEFTDRGYISQKLFKKLLEKDITLITRAKKNMKNKLMDFQTDASQTYCD